MRLSAGDIDRGIELYRTSLLPEMETLEGFCSASLLVNRESGRACSTTTYDTREAMDASAHHAWAIREVNAVQLEQQLPAIREAGVRDAGADVVDVVECDLVLAHLRLPELV